MQYALQKLKSLGMRIYFVLVLFSIFTASINAQEPDTTSIKLILENYYPSCNLYVGSACHERYLNTQTEEILNTEFNYVTPANEFKQSYIHSEPDKWQWTKSDIWINQCAENNQIMRLHAPISPQCSKWVKDDSRTAEELDLILEEYMTALCTTYCNKSHVKWLDVVNETINKDGTWFGPKEGTDTWENPWTIIGFDETNEIKPPLYIKKAFTIANQYAPNTKQIINQHGAFEEVVWTKMKKLVSYLRSNNLTIDGVGWQAHIDLGWELEEGNLQRLSEFIDWCHSNNLEFHITEFNVWLKSGDELKYTEQANTFYEVVKLVASKHNTGIVGVNFWHIRGVETANPDRDGCPWDENYKPKPAYYKIKQALIEASKATDIESKNKESNELNISPNPANNKLFWKEKSNSQRAIFNGYGQIINISTKGNIIDISSLESGIYIASELSTNGVISKKFIKL